MYSEEDINSAIAAGALSAESAANFRSHMSARRALPRQSEENFRLINSFNDIFVAIGVVILLVAVGAIGQALAGFFISVESYGDFYRTDPSSAQAEAWRKADAMKDGLSIALTGAFVAATAWPLAEFFTRKRHMALPSILLLLAFVGGVFVALLGAGMTAGMIDGATGAIIVASAGLAAAGAAWVHWRRFMVPITVAAGAAAVGATIIALIAAMIGPDKMYEDIILTLVFLTGLGVFAVAMRWDISDRERITRRSDVAFWLHLLAAPAIAHPIFNLLGVTDGRQVGVGAAIAVVVVYVVFGLIALAIDRRALLVSALAYVLFALTFLFREFGAVELNFALTALVIGSALLSLSAYWQPIRASVVAALPEIIREKLPETQSQDALVQTPAT